MTTESLQTPETPSVQAGYVVFDNEGQPFAEVVDAKRTDDGETWVFLRFPGEEKVLPATLRGLAEKDFTVDSPSQLQQPETD